MIEAMTEGGFKKRGVLFAPEDALEKDPVVFKYVRSYLEKIEILRENSQYQIGEISFSTGPKHRHGVETYGINFKLASPYGFIYYRHAVLPGTARSLSGRGAGDPRRSTEARSETSRSIIFPSRMSRRLLRRPGRS